MKPHIVVLAVIFMIGAVHSLADEIGDKLDFARAEWKEATRKVAAALEKEIAAAIDKLAESGDLDAVQVVRDEQKAFEDDGEIPTSPTLRKAATAFRQERRKVNDKLIAAFKSTISSYTKTKLFDQAMAIDAEMKQFVRDENEYLNSPDAGSSKGDKSIATIKTFAERFLEQLSAVAGEQTTAKQDVAHAAMMKKLDEEIRTKSVTLRFPLVDIRAEDSKIKYQLSLDSPVGFGKIDGVYRYLNRITNVPLKKDEALRTKPGDIVVVSGTLRFGPESADIARSVALVEIRPDGYRSDRRYCIHLQNFKVAIEHVK